MKTFSICALLAYKTVYCHLYKFYDIQCSVCSSVLITAAEIFYASVWCISVNRISKPHKKSHGLRPSEFAGQAEP
jgi:hypothetical protein